MRLKLDENLGQRTSEVFKRQGHEVSTVPGQKLTSASDRDLIQVCRREDRCLVTLDLDFGNPLLFHPTAYAGIAVLRLPSRPSHQDLLDVAETLAQALNLEPIKGKLWIVQRGRVREYQNEEGGE
jgi:predicted nuclease of predicted toxin-antitoxin system